MKKMTGKMSNLTRDPGTDTHRLRPTWTQHLNAWMLATSEKTAIRLYGDRKRALFTDLAGVVLEIGPGTGVNLPYYPRDIHWIGIEPNPAMHGRFRKKVEQLDLTADFRIGTAERIEIPDNSVDAVVSTLVLCSANNPVSVLRETYRVLKPGGRFIFIEHVAAPAGTALRWLQHLVKPIWKILADGCHPDRETGVMIEQAGFDSLTYDRFRIKDPFLVVAPHIAGVATKSHVSLFQETVQ